MAIHDAARRAATAAASGPPFEPMVLNRTAVAARSALKVAVLNAAGGADFDAILACLTRPPLADAGTLLLCEASWRMPRHGMGRIRAQARSGAQAELRVRAVVRPGHAIRRGSRSIGNAILCSQPLEDFRAVALARPPFRSYRHPLVGAHQGVLASIRADGRRVTIGVVHLERRWDPEGRGRQMEDFLRAIGDAGAGHYWRRPQHDHDGHGPAVVAA